MNGTIAFPVLDLVENEPKLDFFKNQNGRLKRHLQISAILD